MPCGPDTVCGNPQCPFQPEKTDELEIKVDVTVVTENQNQAGANGRKHKDAKKVDEVEKDQEEEERGTTRKKSQAKKFYYGGVKLGHKNCLNPNFRVPKHMGWLWNLYDPLAVSCNVL